MFDDFLNIADNKIKSIEQVNRKDILKLLDI